MTLSKKFLALAAAGALTAATAVPALALENEFHGMYRLIGSVSNFEASTTAQGFFAPEGLDKKTPTATFMEQRARLMYIAKASDNLKLVTHFEIDSLWGKSSYNVSRSDAGGALGADSVNLETKSVYLDFNIPATPVNMKVGMQPFNDAFKGILFDADMAGVKASATFGKIDSTLGFFRFDDKGTPVAGRSTRDMIALDVKFNPIKNLKVGGAYYVVNDDRNSTANPAFLSQQGGLTNIVHTLGVNAEGVVGPVTLDGFLVYQFGNLEAPVNRHVSAFAGNVAAKLKAGPGTVRSEFLYISGDGGNQTGSTSNAFQSVNSVDTEHGYYNGEMMILMRDKYAMTIDDSVVYSSNNKDQGVIGGFVGYDMGFSDKLSASLNAGFAAVAKTNLNKPHVRTSANVDTGKGNDSNFLGSEVNVEVNYKLYDNLTVVARAAYMVLGDYYKGVALNGQDPRDPYKTNLIFNYTF